jgi:hypothetical protein
MTTTLQFSKLELRKLLAKLNPNDELMLVYDHGIYIMSFGDKVENRTIVYARGCNPHTDKNFYDNKCDLAGGDDGADSLGTARNFLKFVLGEGDLKVLLSETQIKIVTQVPYQPPKGKQVTAR